MEIRDILKDYSAKVGNDTYTNGWNKYLGFGQLNTFEAVIAAMPEQYMRNGYMFSAWPSQHFQYSIFP